MLTHNDSLWVNALEQHADSLQRSMDSLQTKFDAIQTKSDLLYSIVETANDGVNNQLASATLWLEILAILIVVVGGIVGYYINYKKRQIEQIALLVEEKKLAVERMASETERLDTKIRHNLSDLYKDLRKEETIALLDRLILEPQDIENICTILCAREIEDSGAYEKLRTAYLKMKNMLKEQTSSNVVNDCCDNYIVLFYQHFFYDALKDNEISQDFDSYYGMIFARAYKRDVIKSTIDLCRALSETTSTFDKELVLTTYLKVLNESQFNQLKELKNIFEQNISPQTLLQDAIEHCKKENISLLLFENSPSKKE